MKKSRFIKGLLLGAISFACLGIASCGQQTTPAPEEVFTGFTPGVATKIKRGELLFLEEFIDYAQTGTYTITISGGAIEGTEDLTDKKRWAADYPGEYKITYTILDGEHAGTYTHTFVVPADNVTWSTTATPIEILYQKDFYFQSLYERLNIYVSSYYAWEPFVENIRVGDTVYEMAENQTSFYVNDFRPHYITYGIRTEDGQTRKSIITANVIYSNTQTTLYLNELSEGTHIIEAANVQSVVINGEACEEATISSEGVALDKHTLYQNYQGVNYVTLQTNEGEVRDTLYVYSDRVSFEDEYAKAPTFLSVCEEWRWSVDISQTSISDHFVTDGEKSLEIICNDYYWPMFVLDIEYLDMIFSSDVDAFAFDMTYAGPSEEYTHRDLTTLNSLMPTYKLYRNQPTTITITRAIYDKVKALIAQAEAAPDGDALKKQTPNGLLMMLQNSRSAAGGWDNPPKVYVDNFRAVRNIDALNLAINATGWYEIQADVKSVQFNGENVPAGKMITTDNGVAIDKAWLSTHIGENSLLITIGDKTYSQAVRVYPTSYNFEDRETTHLFTPSYGTDKTMAVVDYNGSKALQMTSPENAGDLAFEVDGGYMHWAFAQEGVECITFDFTMLFEISGDTHTQTKLNYDGRAFGWSGAANTFLFDSGVTQTLRISKAQYETWAALSVDTFRMVVTNRTWALTWYIDNWEVHCYQQSYDFEDGYLPGIFGKFSNNFTLEMENTNAGKALKLSSTTAVSNPTLEISAEYLHWAFSQDGVESLSFDVTANFVQTGDRNTIVIYQDMRVFGTSGPYVAFENGIKGTFTITKAQYEAWAALSYASYRLPMNSRNYQLTWYIDNLQINKA